MQMNTSNPFKYQNLNPNMTRISNFTIVLVQMRSVHVWDMSYVIWYKNLM